MKTHRQRFLTIFLSLIVLLLFASLYVFGPYLGAMLGQPIYLIPPSPERYGRVALDFMETMGLYAGDDAWQQARQEAEAAIERVDSREDVDPILEKAAKVAGGKHSFIMTPEENQEKDAGTHATLPQVDRQGEILLLTLPGFMGNRDQAQAYADALAQAIDANRDVQGVIVDLRENTGGDMGPMVAGLSPLLPDGDLLYFESRQGQMPVTTEGGVTQGGGTPLSVTVTDKLNVPVAILQGPKTASSGEATLLAFKGLDQVRFFGQPTAGYASANIIIPLYGGSSLVLTMSKDIDRTGAAYAEDPIPPDVDAEDAMAAAKEWILRV